MYTLKRETVTPSFGFPLWNWFILEVSREPMFDGSVSWRENMQKTSLNGGTTTYVAKEPKATSVEFVEDAMVLTLEDGRTLTVPLEWFPRLRDATDEDRCNWRFIGKGYGIHWPNLDEDISVPGLLGLPD